MSDVDLIREAAALMRERAEWANEGPWRRERTHRGTYAVCADGIGSLGSDFVVCDAEHIASWHPAVALAVADWLDALADDHMSNTGNPSIDRFFNEFDTAPDVAALVVARAYLGRDA